MTSLRPGTPAAPRFYPCGVEFSEVIKHRKMVRAFTPEPLAPGVTDRLLRAANRAPSAGFSQGYSFLVLEGSEQTAPLWEVLDRMPAPPVPWTRLPGAGR